MHWKLFTRMIIVCGAMVLITSCGNDCDNNGSLSESMPYKWGENGVPVCTGGWDVREEKICNNGFGQYMIAWSDLRAGNSNFDIYIQTLDTNGAPLWSTNGNPVCKAPMSQENLVMVADGIYGGVNIAWVDQRNGTDSNIYAQQIGLGGDQAWWPADGVAICTASGNQLNPQIAANGEGGSIIAWEDRRGGELGVYVQAVNHFGFIQWADNGLALSTNAASPQITSDGEGGAIIVWEDYDTDGNGDIYAQKVDAQGNRKWGDNGVVVCGAANRQQAPQIITDGAGGAFIAWQDSRNDAGDRVYVQWVYGDGGMQFEENGIAVTNNTAGSQKAPILAYTGMQFYPAIICWNDSRSGTDWDIYAQWIDLDGGLMWDESGTAVCTAKNDQKAYQLAVGDNVSSVTIVWEDYREFNDPNLTEVYTQQLDGSGNIVGPKDGVLASAGGYMQHEPDVAPDGVIVWREMNMTDGKLGIFAQSY